MKSSLPVADIHNSKGTHWNNFKPCKIPCPTTDGHMTTEKQL